MSLAAEKICFTRLYHNLCARSVRESINSSLDKSASPVELSYVLIRLVKPSISCLAILCTLSFRDCEAVVFSVNAKRFRNSDDDFLNTSVRSEGRNFVHTTLKKSNIVSDNWLKKCHI